MRVAFFTVTALAFTVCSEGAEIGAETESASQSDFWVVDMDQSRLGFTAVQAGDSITGAFGDFSAAIRFDPDHLEGATIDVSVDMKSARTGDRQRDLALPGKEWFYAKRYPAAHFVSSDVALVGDDAYEARGTLTIRDVSKDVVLPFTLAMEGDEARAEGALTLMRIDYGVGQGGEWDTEQWVDFEVRVDFAVTAHRAS
ncbi:MAG: YceI family protein [Parvularculaceae bacterium]